jgi:glycosyltransferase involved in cell wall biosynthesis
MKIAAVTSVTIPATTANSIQAMKACHALAQLGHQVSLIIPGRTPSTWQDLSQQYGLKEPFEVQVLPARKWLKRYDFALAAVSRAVQNKADLLYTWSPQAAVLGLWHRMPVILEFHDLPTGKLGPVLLRYFFKVDGNKRLLCITQALAEKLETLLGDDFKPDMVQIAPNGTDLSQYLDLPDSSTARKILGLTDKFTVGYTGHFYKGRGTRLLVSLAKAYPDVQFLWVGGNPADMEFWKGNLAQDGIENVILTGFVPNAELPLYQAAADVLLMPYETAIAGSGGGNSAEICSPMKMFDYLASGRVILTSDLHVFHEVLNENNAVFCPPEDETAWIEKLGEVMQDQELSNALGRQARQDAERYTWLKRAEKALTGLI